MFLVFAPFIGLKIGIEQFLIVVLVTFLVAFSLTALGFVIAWRMESSQGFHAIINLFLIPLWMLSGALFPVSGASGWIQWLMRINPLTYGMDALLLTLFPATTRRHDVAIVAFHRRAGAFCRRSVHGGIRGRQPPAHAPGGLIKKMTDYSLFPALNATLNGASAILITTGRALIARKQVSCIAHA